ncbi:hypothetical protein RB608_11875 [Nocardioides sp. LHD-245]|uniref:hypothetical protein n=1 Tax=Nocardioides sp. LHD-245 TaxID=3051387 RepID=UPI0027E11058|nr:hypothetical protein [Nocardioides sp. LHD-245]
MADLLAVALGLGGFIGAAWLLGLGPLARDHWHFVGHRVPGECCGETCPHHRPGCYHPTSPGGSAVTTTKEI